MQGQQTYFSDQHLNADQPMIIEGTNIHFQHKITTPLETIRP